MMDSLAAQPTASIPLAAAGWADTKACYRLLSNEHFEPFKILGCHADKSVERAGAYPVVLCLQDTRLNWISVASQA
jgi:hypothetical protein